MEIKLTSGHFYGETRECRAIPGFRLMETRYPPGIKIPKHLHESGCFSLMLQGALTENYWNRTLEWTSRGVGFNPPGEEHSNIVHDNGAHFFIVELGPEWIRRAHENEVNLDEAAVFRGGVMNWLGFRLYREAQSWDAVSSLAIEGLALEMIAELSRGAKLTEATSPYWLRQARDLIHAQFTESLTVSRIAETVGIHPVHLARMFQRNYGSTIGDYVRRLRTEFACNEISSTDLPLSEIAVKAGFYDQGHLSRIVKQFTGMTPAQHRSLFRSRYTAS